MSPARQAITSPTNARVKAAVRLRDHRERERTGLTIVDGARELLRALEHSVIVEEAFVSAALIRTADAVSAFERLREASAAITDVSAAVLGKIGFGDRSDGLVAIIRSPTTSLDDLVVPPDAVVVVVESIEKPGNLGAILRTADAARADAVIVADARTDIFNPNAIRASLGTIFTVPLATASSPVVIDWLTSHAIRPIAARVDAPAVYSDLDLGGPLAVVLGSEAVGLSSFWTHPRVEQARIPMLGAADSLNVSVAAAVMLFEVRRQRASGAAR
jgi:TrmH family RNA methyltransferase